MSGTTADVLNQADALLAPMEITPARYLAAELFIGDNCAGLADQRELTLALGLGPAPEKRTFDSAARRAVPDGFRRGRQSGRRSG
jgi:hypothetical protein